MFASRYGIWCILQLGLPAKMQDCVVELLFALEHLTLKFYRTSQLGLLQGNVLSAFATGETLFPHPFASIVKHFLTHVLAPKAQHGFVRGLGPSMVTGMLASERMNKWLNGLSAATVNVEESVARAYSRAYHLEMMEIDADPNFGATPPYLLPDIYIQVYPYTYLVYGYPNDHFLAAEANARVGRPE